MPTRSEILASITQLANDAFLLAVFWHVAVAAALVALAAGWRPSRRTALRLLALPLVSVAVMAWVSGNPFNGTMFAVLVVGLDALARRLPATPVEHGPAWTAVVGGAMVAFGWVYPHFLEGRSPLAYLYGAPVGLLPCPSLALVMGLALLGDGLGSRAVPLVLGAFGALYAVVGVAWLGVGLDVALFVGAVALLALVAHTDEHAAPPAPRAA